MTRGPRSGGSALVVVLLLVSLLIVLAAEMGVRSATDMRAAENQLTELQARQGLQGALAHAAGLLNLDLREDQKVLDLQGLPKADWPDETWAQEVKDQPLGDGTYGFRITDESGRLNPNRLIDASGAQVPAEQTVLRRLLEAACPGLDTEPLLAAWGDWIDADAVGQYETGFDPPLAVTPRNLPFLTPKELFLLPVATTDLLLGTDGRGGVLPHLSCWPPPQVNVNTAPRETLYALSPLFTESVYAQVKAARPLRDLGQLEPLLGVSPLPPELQAALAVTSQAFRVSLWYAKGSDVRRATAVIVRGGPTPLRLWWDPDPICP